MDEEIFQRLSCEQQDAVCADSTRIRIVASPGSGKTETLTCRIVRLLLQDIQPASIVAFTFTEKAAQNMKERVYDRVSQTSNKSLVKKLGKMFVGTMHAYAMQILRDYCDYGHYDMMDEHQEVSFLIKHGWEIGIGAPDRYEGRSFADKCISFLDNLEVIHNELLDLAQLESYSTECAKFVEDVQQYYQKLDEEQLMTLGRIIPLTIKGLREKEILERLGVKHLLVDEFQDINNAQYEFIKELGISADLFIVGDPRQTIYQWRGSDCSCFIKFHEQVSTHDVSLCKNRRSTTCIINLANQFSGTLLGDYDLMEGTREDAGLTQYSTYEDPEAEAEKIAERIIQYHEQGFAYSDMAILLRSVKTSAKPFINIFREKNIPFCISGRTGLFSRGEIQALGAVFAWLSAKGFWTDPNLPFGENRLKDENILEFALGQWQECAAHLGIAFNQERTRYKLEEIKKKLMDVKVRASEFENIIILYYEILDAFDIRLLDYQDKNHAVVMANLGCFSVVLTDFETPHRRRGANPEWQKLLNNLNWYLVTYASSTYAEWMAEDKTALDAVLITTVHQAKGLEWSIVFIPSLTGQRFPSSRTHAHREWKIPDSFFDKARYEGSLDDERRLFYVAITRAKDYLFLSCFERINRPAKPSQFLDEIMSQMEMDMGSEFPKPLSRSYLDKKLITFAVGDIVRFQQCPYRYLLNNLWEFQPHLSMLLGYGKDIHYILRRLGEEIRKGAAPDDIIDAFTERYFMLPFVSKEFSDNLAKNVAQKLKVFYSTYSEELDYVEEVESRIEYLLEGDNPTKVTLKGIIDLLTTKDGLAIRDYKTEYEPSASDDSIMQLQLYALGMKCIDRPVNAAAIAYVDSCSLQAISIKDADLNSASVKAKSIIEDVINKRYYPSKVKEKCAGCDYARICRHV